MDKIIGTYTLCNFGGLVVLDIIYGIDDKLTTAFSFGDGIKGKRTTKIFYDANGRDYVKRYGRKYYLDEIERV